MMMMAQYVLVTAITFTSNDTILASVKMPMKDKETCIETGKNMRWNLDKTVAKMVKATFSCTQVAQHL